MILTRLAAYSVGLAIVFSAPAASADSPVTPEQAACAHAYEEGDRLANHATGESLLDARALLAACASRSCADWMVKDCRDWLVAIEARLPTVIFEVKNDAGEAITQGQVSTDGRVLQDRFDGRAVELNPGEHEVTFLLADGRSVRTSIVLHEREKRRTITATFPRPAPATPPPPVAPPPTSSEPISDASLPPAEPERSSSPLRPVGYVVAGVGVLGLGLGIGFGLKASSHKSEANCDARFCDSAALSDARVAADLSTVGFVVGGGLLVAGVAMVLLAPSSTKMGKNGGSLQLTPAVSHNHAGLRFRAAW